MQEKNLLSVGIRQRGLSHDELNCWASSWSLLQNHFPLAPEKQWTASTFWIIFSRISKKISRCISGDFREIPALVVVKACICYIIENKLKVFQLDAQQKRLHKASEALGNWVKMKSCRWKRSVVDGTADVIGLKFYKQSKSINQNGNKLVNGWADLTESSSIDIEMQSAKAVGRLLLSFVTRKSTKALTGNRKSRHSSERAWLCAPASHRKIICDRIYQSAFYCQPVAVYTTAIISPQTSLQKLLAFIKSVQENNFSFSCNSKL